MTKHRIPRRDFLQGSLVAAASTLTGPLLSASALAAAAGAASGGSAAAQDKPDYYPPLLNGMRGSHPGSFENAHALRDGTLRDNPVGSGESYDLVVVGGGISGLAAAHFYRARAGAASRILVLDNHDDFGGHAKRNEFRLGGAMQLMNGGTYFIDSPRPYSRVAEGLIRTLGIDVAALKPKIERRDFYEKLGLGTGAFFDRETFGADKLVLADGENFTASQLSGAPLSAKARADIERIELGTTDYFPGLTSDQKKLRLSKISYRDYLRDVVHADPAAIAFYQARTHAEWAVGIDAVSALDCWGIALPGFRGLKLAPGSIPTMGYTPAGYADTGGSPSLHFPDGNATIARALVRNLIPAAIPGLGIENLVTARANYARLDQPGAPLRIRLSSTVVRAVNVGGPAAASGVAVTYVRDGSAYTVRARYCVLACYNMMIPYLCPEMPVAQKQALHSLVKAPLVYTSVALRNWQAFARLKVSRIYSPGGYFAYILLNEHVNIGTYRSPKSPDQPILVHMIRTPCKPGLSEDDQARAGRAELLATPFATFEHNVRDQLARTLGAGGLDPARDITAITVNRWPHGYAPEFNSLWNKEVPEAQRPEVVGRAPFGRIHVANSDAGAAAYTDSAIDQAHRAMQEILT
ncbi:MAG: NAD(P)-binding protein [Proteobacteria bacterium]|nr:NAD(P)-binding protein [Pseudomonadota bacterium]